MTVITSREQYILERANTNDRLSLAHAQIKGTKQDDEKLRQDMRDTTVEGRGNYSKYIKDIEFAVENNISAQERLNLVHSFDNREAQLLELHKRHKLTPVKE